MRFPRLALALVTALPLAACGGGGSSNPDAKVNNTPDTAMGTPDAPIAAGCDFTEAADATNDATPEASAIALGGAAAKTVCGTINTGHFDTSTVDLDGYAFSVTTAGDFLFRLDTSPAAGALANVVVSIDDGQTGLGFGVLQVDHGVFSSSLPAGDYFLSVVANDAGDPAAPIDYKVKILPDTPATRCPTITATANYTEAHDGAASADNDVVYVNFNSAPQYALTPSTTDLPEDSGIVVAPATSYRISGSSANVNVAPPNGDEYNDRDTFTIATGAATNELEIRFNWAGTADMDFLVFPENGIDSDIGGGTAVHDGEDEFATIAVKPSSKYWIWVGAYDASTPLPAAYDLSICGKTYTAN
ncbi:MAG: hypothetical protein K8W52_09935 [Deltaproteobacteria bacterium]|nr:hypothetical protein [Deltaproteobacteria bacterium]